MLATPYRFVIQQVVTSVDHKNYRKLQGIAAKNTKYEV